MTREGLRRLLVEYGLHLRKFENNHRNRGRAPEQIVIDLFAADAAIERALVAKKERDDDKTRG